MLAKLPEQQRKSRTSDLDNNVNTKLAGLTVVLIIMLGLTGGYMLLPLLPSTQPADIATNLANNNTTYTPASATPTKVHSSTTKSVTNKTKTSTPTNTAKINNTTPKTVKTNSASASKSNNT
jgi:hypothetical protein